MSDDFPDLLLDGLGIGGYRSFGDDLQRIGPLSKINLLAGQNNSGKSNVLRFVHERIRSLVGTRRDPSSNEPLDVHRPTATPLQFAIATHLDGRALERLRSGINANQIGAHDSFERVMRSLADRDGLIWWTFRTDDGRDPRIDMSSVVVKNEVRNDWATVAMSTSSLSSGNQLKAYVDHAVSWMVQRLQPPETVFIPAIREIGAADKRDGPLTGADLIHRLADLQNPSIHEQQKKDQFEAINEFVRAVTGDASASIEIPVQRNTVHVHLGSHVLPIENLGTGIHEVTMIAAWSTIFQDTLVCLEEPEIHLHPLLQRKLLQYLGTHTSNQYLVATHSAHFVDEPDAAVFHVRLADGQTRVKRAIAPAERIDLCADLGYRPSDLLQANAVIWVEGPTDRLYLRHWLSAVDPDLVEGVHYSLMFYGGRLLSHLSADDVEVDDFIALRRINRWLSIVIDSDKSKLRQQINKTKQRVCTELDGGPGLAWVTHGREIENYVPTELLNQAVQLAHPGARLVVPQDLRFGDMTQKSIGGKRSPFDKLKVAHHVVDEKPDLTVMDLRAKVRALARFVRQANGMT